MAGGWRKNQAPCTESTAPAMRSAGTAGTEPRAQHAAAGCVIHTAPLPGDGGVSTTCLVPEKFPAPCQSWSGAA